MTPPQPTITIRRAELARALSLPAIDFRVLMALAMTVQPSSGRTWEAPERLALRLGLTEALLTSSLKRLAREDFLEEQPGVMKGLPSIELGPLLIRGHEAPPNLPLEPRPPV